MCGTADRGSTAYDGACNPGAGRDVASLPTELGGTLPRGMPSDSGNPTLGKPMNGSDARGALEPTLAPPVTMPADDCGIIPDDAGTTTLAGAADAGRMAPGGAGAAPGNKFQLPMVPTPPTLAAPPGALVVRAEGKGAGTSPGITVSVVERRDWPGGKNGGAPALPAPPGAVEPAAPQDAPGNSELDVDAHGSASLGGGPWGAPCEGESASSFAPDVQNSSFDCPNDEGVDDDAPCGGNGGASGASDPESGNGAERAKSCWCWCWCWCCWRCCSC